MESIFLSLTKSDLQDIIAETVNACLRRNLTIPQPETDALLTVPQAAAFLSLSVPTVYTLISKGVIPHMKRSKKVYFTKLELIEYLKQGRKKTTAEIEVQTDAFLKSRKTKPTPQSPRN